MCFFFPLQNHKIIQNINVADMNEVISCQAPSLSSIRFKFLGTRTTLCSLIYETQMRLSEKIGLNGADSSDMENISSVGQSIATLHPPLTAITGSTHTHTHNFSALSKVI